MDDRKLEVLRAIVTDYVSSQEPVGVEIVGRTSRPRRFAGDGPQRYGCARGRGLHHPAAHQCWPHPNG